MFEDQKVKDALKAFQGDLCSKKAHELGYTFTENDGHLEQQFKAMMFGAAGFSDETITKAAFEMLEKFKAGDKKAIHPNLRGSVYAIVLDLGGKAEYDVVEHEAINAETSVERNTALRALGRAKSPELIQRTLDLSLSKHVKTQDIYMPLSGLRGHAEGTEALWKFTKDNWNELVKRLPVSLPLLSSVVAMATSSFTHREHIKDIEAFFKDKSTKGFDMSLSQALDSVSAKAAWLERDSEDVKTWLQAHKYL